MKLLILLFLPSLLLADVVRKDVKIYSSNGKVKRVIEDGKVLKMREAEFKTIVKKFQKDCDCEYWAKKLSLDLAKEKKAQFSQNGKVLVYDFSKMKQKEVYAVILPLLKEKYFLVGVSAGAVEEKVTKK